MSEPPGDQEAEEADLRAHIRETEIQVRLALQALSEKGRESRTG